MNFSCCILLCGAAFIIVACNNIENNKCLNSSYLDLKSFLDRAYNQTNDLCYYRSVYRQCQENGSLLKSQIQAISNILFYPPFVYNNKKYFISNFPHKDVADAMTYCTAFGGYLAEIDDDNEYKALQSFVLRSPPDLVVIGGSDAAVEGTWIFPRTGLPVRILDWAQGQPRADMAQGEDCLNIWKSFRAKLNDLPCGFRSSGDRFMCEVPIYF